MDYRSHSITSPPPGVLIIQCGRYQLIIITTIPTTRPPPIPSTTF